jgi:type IV pilus assembly protein PilW
MRPRSSPRGLSLVELLVASTVSILAIGMATMGLLSQNKALQVMDMTRGANEQTRDALIPLEESLRTAGWGIDPRYALDFSYNCPLAPAKCRDSRTDPDQLAFVSRNPFYRWLAQGEGTCTTAGGCFSGNAWPIQSVDTAASPKTVTTILGSGQKLEKGRVMLATCSGGQNAVMFTLGTAYTGAGVAVTLTPVSPNLPPYNDYNSLQPCHGQTGAALYMVDRNRFFVSVQGGVPWLMLDTGVDLNGDGALPPNDTADLLPVSKNVEDFQVAYVLNSSTGFIAPDSNTDWIVGNDKTPSTAEEPDPTAAAPLYTTSATDPSRFSMNPANVRSIRLTLTIRSDRTDSGQRPGWTGDTLTAAENRTGTISGGRYHRSFAKAQVTLRNMDTKGPFTF